MSGLSQVPVKYMSDILVDTNVMVYCFDRKLDLRSLLDGFLQSKFTVFTLAKCIKELSSIKRNDVEKFFSSFGIKILDFDDGKTTDDTILNKCSSDGYILFTEDKALIKRAKAIGVKTVSFAGKTLKFS